MNKKYVINRQHRVRRSRFSQSITSTAVLLALSGTGQLAHAEGIFQMGLGQNMTDYSAQLNNLDETLAPSMLIF